MRSSTSAGESQVTVVNGTRRVVRVAIYKRSPLRSNEPPIAWQVVSPPPRGKTIVFLPRGYQVCARYSFEPEDPRRPIYQTNVLQVPHAPAGAGFVIEGVSSPDRRTWGAVLTRAAEGPGWRQIRVANRFSLGVWSHVRQDGRDIFSPRVLPPQASLIEDLSSPFYLAVLPLPRAAGDLLPNSELASTEISVNEKESVTVKGGPHRGFKLARISARDSVPVAESAVERAPEKKPKVKTRPI